MPRGSPAGRLFAALAASGCAGGGIASNSPASNGQSFVSGSPGTTLYRAGTGPVAPAVSGPLVGGGRAQPGRYRGHVVVLNFWGSWCPPCRAEAPGLAQLARQYGPSGVRFLGVDIRDSPATAEAFMSDFRITYPSLNDPERQPRAQFPGHRAACRDPHHTGHIAQRPDHRAGDRRSDL